MSKQKILEQKKASKLDKQLMAYSLAAGAVLVGGQTANATIIHTDLDPHVVLNTNNATLDFDFGNCGTNQFLIKYRNIGQNYRNSLMAKTDNASWRGGTGNGSSGPSALDYGQNVKNIATSVWGRHTNKSRNLAQNYTYSLVYNGHFLNTSNKYIGVRFHISGNQHYGWIQFGGVKTGIITGYAYNDEIDGDIFAGQTVPEVGSLGLLALGAVGLTAWRKKRS